MAASSVRSVASYDSWFDTRWGRYAFQVERTALEEAAGALGGQVVLDVGVGTGRFTAGMEARAGWTTALDIDPVMLAVASTRLHGPLSVADAHHLPYRSEVFDLVVAVTLCEFTAEPALVIAEMARVTKPGGRIIVGALNRWSPWGIVRRRHLRQPPWSNVQFFRPRKLLALGASYGRASVSGNLFAPGVSPPVVGVGQIAEVFGRKVAPGLGAFQVLIIERGRGRPLAPHSLSFYRRAQ
jgi:SAM-dependent methyltransferase